MFDVQLPSQAEMYRRKAQTCFGLAACARSAPDRALLLSMRDTWLARAANQDALDWPPPLPPANANALRVPRPR